MKIKDLPPKLKELALQEQERQGNQRNEELDLCDSCSEGNFDWNKTSIEDGVNFWDLVDDGLFEEARQQIYDWETEGNEGEADSEEHLTIQDTVQNFLDDRGVGKPKEGDKKIRVFEGGSKRDDDSNKPLVNHLDAYVRLRFGYRLRDGANKYDKGNWRKLQPNEAALEALNRHLAYYELNMQNGVEQDEDHLAGIIFNVMLLMKNEEKEGIKADHFFGTTK